MSGEQIARELGVSRSAVWKAINELKKDGYRIGAATNRGYCLSEDNDILSVPGMAPYLSDPKFAEHIALYPSLESTNRTAKELAVAGACHGTVIVSDCQTAGRGRYRRQFYSPPGSGVYMSFVLRPERLRLETPTLVTALAAVAVCGAVMKISARQPAIKWVNDVCCDGKKVCGILTEAVTDMESGNMEWVVVGIGINFTAPEGGFPEDIRHTAGALFPDDPAPVTRNQLAAEIINMMLDPAGHDRQEMLAKYKSLLFMLGKRIRVVGAQSAYDATAIDIDEAGRLIVSTEDGETKTLSAGEIRIEP